MIAKSGVLVSIKKFALLRKQYLQWRISSLGKTLCTKCKVYKEEDQFCKDVRRKSGLQAQCRECQRTANRLRTSTPEGKLAKQKRDAKYRTNNREAIRDAARKRYSIIRDKAISRSREWYANNKERAKARQKAYAKNNKEKYSFRRYFSLVIAPIIRERDGNKCCACGSRSYLQVHHIIPAKYDKSKREDEKNLLTLCKDCHMLAHDGNFKIYDPVWADLANDYINTIYKDKTNEPPISTPVRNLLLFQRGVREN